MKREKYIHLKKWCSVIGDMLPKAGKHRDGTGNGRLSSFGELSKLAQTRTQSAAVTHLSASSSDTQLYMTCLLPSWSVGLISGKRNNLACYWIYIFFISILYNEVPWQIKQLYENWIICTFKIKFKIRLWVPLQQNGLIKIFINARCSAKS